MSIKNTEKNKKISQNGDSALMCSEESDIIENTKEEKAEGIRRLVVICASTGGPKALHKVLFYLPDNLNAPVLIVQHMPKGFTESLADRLGKKCGLNVKEAEDGDKPEKGKVYVAKGGMHMKLTEDTKDKDEEKKDTAEEKNNACLQLIYKQLLENEVDEKYINQLITEIEPALKKDGSVENILSGIYQKIVLKLGKTEVMGVTQGKARFVFFIGPTGVGKTTTIAKLASKLKLDRKLNVALLTADTYRIAAVDQLKTYAEILNVPLKVVYSDTELKDAYEEMKNYDIVLIDTAGRSHRDKQQREDIEKLISAVPAEERDIFLVLSITTKYRDLIRITQSYSEIAEYRLIFTKLDETDTLGNIFNVKLLTGAPLSYATFGQKVPNDISRLDAQMIAKQLLGGSD